MLIDDVTIHVRAGSGGDGVVRFARALMTQGPTGGDGGRGGDIIVRGVSDLGALRVWRNRKTIAATDGKDGGQDMCTGASGANGEIIVPVGTIVHDLSQGTTWDITTIGQTEVIARGGNGGFGNYYYRSSRIPSPTRANPGMPGEEKDIRFELKLIADVGLIGYPNVGKSSLLNALTRASSKVANYAFTTLEPHLGVYHELIIADLPGLIEGAAEGKGLGHKFLRHIERTRALVHLVAADSEDPLAAYRTIRAELRAYNPALCEKPEWIVVSRSDERSPEAVAAIVAALQKENPHVIALSLLDDARIAAFTHTVLHEIAMQKHHHAD